MKPTTDQRQQIEEIIEEAQRQRFFGTVSLQFNNGELVLIRREQTIRPRGWRPKPKNGGEPHDQPQHSRDTT